MLGLRFSTRQTRVCHVFGANTNGSVDEKVDEHGIDHVCGRLTAPDARPKALEFLAAAAPAAILFWGPPFPCPNRLSFPPMRAAISPSSGARAPIFSLHPGSVISTSPRAW